MEYKRFKDYYLPGENESNWTLNEDERTKNINLIEKDTLKNYIINKITFSNKCDFSSVKFAVDLLEKFDEYEQVISTFDEHELKQNTQFGNVFKSKYYNIEVDFVDKNEIGQFQIIYRTDGNLLDPNILNTCYIQRIEAFRKIPKICFAEFKKYFSPHLKIQYFPFHETEIHKVICCNREEAKFFDISGRELIVFITDAQFVMLDKDNKLFRTIPLFELLKPELEKLDFSKCNDNILKDYEYNDFSNTKFGSANLLKHYFDNESNSIFYQIFLTRTGGQYYYYHYYDIIIKIDFKIKVTIKEGRIGSEYFPETGENSLQDYY